MMKELSNLARAELELDAMWAGKLWAFVVRIEGSFVGLGVAVANQPGYSPIPMQWCHGDNYNAMSDHADMLNKTWLGLDDEAAWRVVASAMAAAPAWH